MGRLFDIEVSLRAAAASTRRLPNGCTDVLIAIADHFEPENGRVDRATASARMAEWESRWPAIAGRCRDSSGRAAPHTFYYPWDEFDASEIESLARICAAGVGEVEIHLHHRDDTAGTLTTKLKDAVGEYARHGLLSQWPDGRPAFGFVHGDWALDNSRSDGGRNWCGVDNELDVLTAAGCYADFTFPAWQHQSQPRMLNTIYCATDDPARPKSHDRGKRVRAAAPLPPGLMLIPGPLVPYMERRGRCPRPAMDDPDLSFYRPYSPARLDRWVNAGVGVAGRPDRVFIKLHTHGAPDENRRALLDSDLAALYEDAMARYSDGNRFRAHFVTTREMYNVAVATAAGDDRGVADVRDYLLPPPHAARANASSAE